MKWNMADITYLYPPDVFTGTFDNEKMQARHEEQVLGKLNAMKTAIELENDPLAALNILHKNDHLQFLQNNQQLFREASKFEEAVLHLYGKLNAPFSSGGDASLWNTLFQACDHERLYSLGEPVSFSSATVYRGSVSGRKRSLSWTPDKKRAENFSNRWKDTSMGGGDLYEVDITKDHVLIYRKLRHDEELLLSPEFIESADIRTYTPIG